MGGNNQYSKNLRTRVAALTTTFTAVLPFDKNRSVVLLKNTSASEVVHISTNLSQVPTDLPSLTDFYPLEAGEVIAFDAGLAPNILWAKGAAGAASLAIIEG